MISWKFRANLKKKIIVHQKKKKEKKKWTLVDRVQVWIQWAVIG